MLGGELAKKNKDMGLYRIAGVGGFAEYISLAVAKELIIVGGIGNDKYVRLHPRFKNVDIKS
jgi:hypothetical protein